MNYLARFSERVLQFGRTAAYGFPETSVFFVDVVSGFDNDSGQVRVVGNCNRSG